MCAGRVVSGYRVRRNNKGQDEWTLIGKKNPMRPQMFYPVENNMTVTKGDKLVSVFNVVLQTSNCSLIDIKLILF